MRPRLKKLLPLLVILLALVVFVVLRATRPEPPPAGDEERRWPIAVMQIEAADLAPQLRLFGELSSDTDAQIKARTPGDVIDIAVRAGQSVRKGELLLQLDDLDARALYQQRRAELQDAESQLEQLLSQHQVDRKALADEQTLLELAERQYQRIRQLFEAGRAAQRELDEAQVSLTQQRLALMNRELAVEQFASRRAQLERLQERAATQVEQARRDLEATRLKAPTDLHVQEVYVRQGDQVASGAPLLSGFQPQRLEMKARLPVSQVPRLRQARAEGRTLHAEARVDGVPLVFELQELAGRSRDTAGAEAIFTLVDGEPEGLALGRFIDAQLSLPEVEGAYWLPAAAVQGRNRVYRVVDERLEGLDVELVGERRQGEQSGVLVRSEQLNSGDRVLATRLPNAMHSLLVEVVEELTP